MGGGGGGGGGGIISGLHRKGKKEGVEAFTPPPSPGGAADRLQISTIQTDYKIFAS